MPDQSTVSNHAPVSPMRIPIFRHIWIASMLSNFGGLIQSVGAAWLMVALNASPQMIALVSATTTLPIMLFSLLAGALADNFDRRRVMLAAQGFMFLVSVALTLCAWLGVLTPALLLAFTFLIGCGTALNGPAWQALVGDMVPREAMPAAVALNSMGFNAARSVGPAVGGAIVAAFGAAAAFLANVVSYIALIAVLLRWRPERHARRLPSEPIGQAMAAGIRYVAMSPGLWVVLQRAFVFGLSAGVVSALMPLIARDLVGGGALTYGVLLGAFGIGAIGGAAAGIRLRRRWEPEAVVRGAILALALGTAVAGLSRNLPLTIVGLMLGGAGWVLALSIFFLSIQLSTPRWVVARALALYQMSAFGAMAVGSWLFGAIAEAHGVSISLLAAAGGQIVAFLLGLVAPIPGKGLPDLDPRDWAEPSTTVPVEPRSGPIVTTIEYRIAPADIPRFLEVMDERRRIRRRDGARHWTLLRDLMEEDLWIERYHAATWLENVRHNQRRTHADTANIEDLLALHRGEGPPIVHRRIERQTRAPSGLTDATEPLTHPGRSN